MKKLLEDRLKNFKIDENGCHIWQGCKDQAGYGMIQIEYKTKRVHKIIYEFVNKVKVSKMFHIDHICRNKACMNIEHLRKVSPRTNTLCGNGPAAINAVKTQCVNGHEFNEENTYITSKGERQCKVCIKIRVRHYRSPNYNKYLRRSFK